MRHKFSEDSLVIIIVVVTLGPMSVLRYQLQHIQPRTQKPSTHVQIVCIICQIEMVAAHLATLETTHQCSTQICMRNP